MYIYIYIHTYIYINKALKEAKSFYPDYADPAVRGLLVIDKGDNYCNYSSVDGDGDDDDLVAVVIVMMMIMMRMNIC
jgi:hypothetical protein